MGSNYFRYLHKYGGGGIAWLSRYDIYPVPFILKVGQRRPVVPDFWFDLPVNILHDSKSPTDIYPLNFSSQCFVESSVNAKISHPYFTAKASWGVQYKLKES